jgi:IS1 family transposase
MSHETRSKWKGIINYIFLNRKYYQVSESQVLQSCEHLNLTDNVCTLQTEIKQKIVKIKVR